MRRPRICCVPRSSIAGEPWTCVISLDVSLKLGLRFLASAINAVRAASRSARVRGNLSARG
jgi:hypothetical protein